MRFHKMHGCGNDYVVVDCLTGDLPPELGDGSERAIERLAQRVNDRRHGVGADGFVLIRSETRPGSPADAEMRMYNPDGSFSAMCGNALRCVAKRLYDDGSLRQESMRVRSGETLVPMRVVGLDDAGQAAQIEADLGAPRFAPAEVPCTLRAGAEGDLRDVDLKAGERSLRATVLSMGNPHCVLFADILAGEAIDDRLVHTLGPVVENHAAFPERTNVEFVEVVDRGRLKQRTWERGAGETLACGSGACAVAVAAALTGRADRRVTIELLGGELQVEWRESDGHVVMTGPAVTVFRGDLA